MLDGLAKAAVEPSVAATVAPESASVLDAIVVAAVESSVVAIVVSESAAVSDGIAVAASSVVAYRFALSKDSAAVWSGWPLLVSAVPPPQAANNTAALQHNRWRTRTFDTTVSNLIICYPNLTVNE